MSHVAILLVVAAVQGDDSGWQTNTDDGAPITVDSEDHLGPESLTVENASFDNLETGAFQEESDTGDFSSIDNDATDGPDLTASLLDPTTHGVVSLAADGTLTYIPSAQFHGVVAFIDCFRGFLCESKKNLIHSSFIGFNI